MKKNDDDIKDSLKNFKQNIQKETLSEDYKNNLKTRLNLEKSNATKSLSLKLKKWIIAFASCFIIITGICFADSIENTILKHFSNIDENTKEAIENNEEKHIVNGFASDQGLDVTAHYLIMKDNNLYIALEVNTDKYEYDEVFVDDITANYGNESTDIDTTIQNHTQIARKYYDIENNNIVFIQIDNVAIDYYDFDLKIKLVTFYKNGQYEFVHGNWNMNINIEE